MSGAGAPWYAEGLRFACTSCGRCCRGPEPGFVEVGRDEIERLAAGLELAPGEFGRRFLRRTSDGRVSLTERPNGDCIFWGAGVGCTVYAARPDQCRTFPFWPEVVATPGAWSAAAADCPGMDRGPRYAPGRIRRILAGAASTGLGRTPANGRRLDTVDPSPEQPA